MDIRERYRRYVNEKGLYSRRGYSSLDHRRRQLFGHAGSWHGDVSLTNVTVIPAVEPVEKADIWFRQKPKVIACFPQNDK